MSTNQVLVEDALREIGVLALGDDIQTVQLNDGLRVLGDMLDEWALEGGYVPADMRHSVAVTTQTREFTIGVGETIDAVVPPRIYVVAYKASYEEDYTPLHETNYEGWIIRKDDEDTRRPGVYWFEKTVPVGRLWFDTVALPGDVFEVKAPGYFHQSDLAAGDTIELPKGYRRAVMTNLAVRMCSTNGVTVERSRSVRAEATNGRKIIMRRNIAEKLGARLDPVLCRRRYGDTRASIRSLGV